MSRRRGGKVIVIANREGSALDPCRPDPASLQLGLSASGGQSLPPLRRHDQAPGAEQVVRLLVPEIEACSPEQWQRAINLMAELLLPQLLEPGDEQEAA